MQKFSKEEVEEACMQENEQRFCQAYDTPFMRSTLLEEFGYLGISLNVEAVLWGTYNPPPGTNRHAIMLLEQLQIPDRVCASPPVPPYITTEEFIQGCGRKLKNVLQLAPTFYILDILRLVSRTWLSLNSKP